MADQKVSSVVQAKLLPGEVVIGQTRSNIADLIATDKRILKFSSGSCETLDYADISGIRYGTFQSKKIVSRILIGICALLLIGIAVMIWAAYLDKSVRNVNFTQALLVSIVCGGFAFLSLTAVFTFDYGYYQIESSKIDQSMGKYWQIARPMFGAKKIDGFFQTVSNQGNITLNKKKQ